MNRVLSLVSTNPLNKFIITDKIGAILNPEYEPTLLFLTGASNTGKSIIGAVKIYFQAMKHGGNGYFISKSKSKVVQLFVDNEFSILKMFPDNTRYVGGGSAGGERIEIITPFGISKIYLANYDNAKSWQNVLGTSAPWFLIDEADQSAEQLLEEVKLRAIRNNGMAIFTSNGNSPENFLYSITNEFYPITQFGRFPDEELHHFVPRNKKWHCIHFNAYDDLVHMEEEVLLEFINSFVVGTYYHRTKIEGIRTTIGNRPFDNFINSETIKDLKGIDKELYFYKQESNSIGVDTSYSTSSKDLIVFINATLSSDGIFYLTECEEYNNNERNDKPLLVSDVALLLNNFCRINGYKQVGSFIDNADQALINECFMRYRQQIKPENSWKKKQIPDRITWIQDLLATKKLIIDKSFTNLINGLKNMSMDPKKDGYYIDKGIGPHYFDAIFYAIAPLEEKQKRLSNRGGR